MSSGRGDDLGIPRLVSDDLVGAAIHQTPAGVKVVAVVEASPNGTDVERFAEMVAEAYDLAASPVISLVSFHRYFDRLMASLCTELFGQGHPATDSAAWNFDAGGADALIITLFLSDPSQLRHVRAEILNPEIGLQNILTHLLEEATPRNSGCGRSVTTQGSPGTVRGP